MGWVMGGGGGDELKKKQTGVGFILHDYFGL
jgi:hypothetical protein